MKILILYGTLTMNSEIVSEYLENFFLENYPSFQITRTSMGDYYELDDLSNYDFYLVGTSTWGEGEFPPDTEEFLERLEKNQTANLNQKKVSFFGLGDSSYDIFNGGIKLLEKELTSKFELSKVGETFLIDGFPDDEVKLSSWKWCEEIIKFLAIKN